MKSHFHPFPFNRKGQGKTQHQPRFSLWPWALRKMSNSMRNYLLDMRQPKLLLARSSSRGRPWISFCLAKANTCCNGKQGGLWQALARARSRNLNSSGFMELLSSQMTSANRAVIVWGFLRGRLLMANFPCQYSPHQIIPGL